MVSHNMMIKEDTYKKLKELKMEMSKNKERKVSFTEVIELLLDTASYDPSINDDREMTYEEAYEASNKR